MEREKIDNFLKQFNLRVSGERRDYFISGVNKGIYHKFTIEDRFLTGDDYYAFTKYVKTNMAKQLEKTSASANTGE